MLDVPVGICICLYLYPYLQRLQHYINGMCVFVSAFAPTAALYKWDVCVCAYGKFDSPAVVIVAC